MYVIFGATGNVGHTTAMQLRAASLPVRTVVRDKTQGVALAKMGCEVAVADLRDPDSINRVLEGAHGVQMLVPLPQGDSHPADTMRATIDVMARVLANHRDAHVVALSDYGAELDFDTGITALFHHFEAALRAVSTKLTLLRSAEHMHNWMRVLPVALSSGVLPSFHDPVDKRFPTIAPSDVGVVSARLLRDGFDADEPHVVSVEGPVRVSANDVAQSIQNASGRPVKALALPRGEWERTLARAGLSDQHAQLIIKLFEVHNAGHIDVEANAGERAFGTTSLDSAVAAMLVSLKAAATHTRAGQRAT
jgi:NAD(P)H dehydrogenase (quinone)